MEIELSESDKNKIERIAQHPYLWLRENVPELKDYEDDLFDFN